MPANYIRHMNKFIAAMQSDNRLKPAHVSLYLTLFACWNKHFFVNPFLIYRPEVMHISRIGSKDGYYSALKALHSFGYIRYWPAEVQGGPAQVSVLPLSKSGPLSASDAAAVLINNPETSVKNRTVPVTKSGLDGGDSRTAPVPKTGHLLKQINKSNKKNSALPTHQAKKTGQIKPPALEEVTTFFFDMRFDGHQAQLFFHHYEANGWLQSNGLPIRNWQAAAEKWVLNAANFKNRHDHENTRLHTGKSNYSEPL